MNKQILIFTVFVLILFACRKEEKVPIGDVDCSMITYSGTISQLFDSHCNTSGCHNAGSDDGDFTTYDLVKPWADNGEIAKETLDKQTMPEDGPLTSEQLGQLQCWLDDGAPNN